MRSLAPLALFAVSLFAVGSTGCAATGPVPRYAEPLPSEPHAAVSITIAHASRPGADLASSIYVDGRPVAATSLGASTIPARIRPGDARWSFYSEFSHKVFVTTLEPVGHADYHYDSCARRDSRGDCVGGTVTSYVTKLEPVTREQKVPDARCDAEGRYALDSGRRYHIAYVFTKADECSVACDDVTSGIAVACRVSALSSPPAAPVQQATPSALPSTHDNRPLHTFGVATAAAGGVGLAVAGASAFVALWHQSRIDVCARGEECNVDPALAARDRDLATNVAAVSFVIGGALAATGVGVIVFGPSKTNVTGGLAPRNGGAELTVGATF